MATTTVGQLRCEDAKPQKRPFVVEWDATDMATFEATAQRDVVIVRYEGCELEILDACNEPSLPGKYGSYLPTSWTSGSVESFNVSNEAELYARLPLGAANFGGHVQAGQSLHLEYFVSGTTRFGRGAVYEGDLVENPNCEGATHFVHSYNLGAFVLSTSAGTDMAAHGGTQKIGAGASNSSTRDRLKRAGDLVACKSDKSRDVGDCRTPIRLSLRKLMPGNTPVAGTPAGETVATEDLSPRGKAKGIRDTAKALFNSGDGSGCIKLLDEAQGIDPKGDKALDIEQTRAFCEMMAGQCEAGKKRYRWFLENVPSGQRWTDEQLDISASLMASKYCTGNAMAPEDRATTLGEEMRDAKQQRDGARSEQLVRELQDLFPKMPTKTDSDDRARIMALHAMRIGLDTMVRKGMCPRAKILWKKMVQQRQETSSRREDFEHFLKRGFEKDFRECSGQ